MNLKAVIRQETASVFLNTDEFAEFISIEDVPETPAICDWSAEPGGEHVSGRVGANRGIAHVEAVITLAAGVIPSPVPGQRLCINHQPWTVREAVEDEALLHLQMFRN